MSSKKEKLEKIKPLRPYLEENISKALQKGLEALCKERPDNPLEYLGKYLMSYGERIQNGGK